MMDGGIATVCHLANIADDGDKPEYKLIPFSRAYFAYRTISYRRQYEAKGANEEVDLLIRIWRDPNVCRGQYVVLTQSVDDGQYEIRMVQHTVDEDNLQVSDITLQKVDQLYDVIADEIEEGSGCPAYNQY